MLNSLADRHSEDRLALPLVPVVLVGTPILGIFVALSSGISAWVLPLAMMVPMLVLVSLVIRVRIGLLFGELPLVVFVALIPLAIMPDARIVAGSLSLPILVVCVPLVAFASWAGGAKAGAGKPKTHLQNELLPLALLVATWLASSVASPAPVDSFKSAITVTAYLLCYWVVSRSIWRLRALEIAVSTYVWSSFAVVALSLISYFEAGGGKNIYMRLVSFDGGHPNHMAIVMEYGVIVTVSWFFTTRSRSRLVQTAVILPVFLIGILLTVSRGAWIAVALGASSSLLLSRSYIRFRRVALSLFVVVGLVAALIILVGCRRCRTGESIDPAILAESNLQRFSRSTTERWVTYRGYLHSWEQHPIVGSGVQDTLTDATLKQAYQPHNSYLAFLVWGGIVGFAGFFWLLVRHGRNLIAVRGILNETDLWGNILVGLFVATLAQMMFETYSFSVLFWALLALQGGATNILPEHARRPEPREPRKKISNRTMLQ